MSLPPAWIAVGAVFGLFLGLLLMQAAWGIRKRRGLGAGRTISLDRVTLTSRRLGLIGRPDRVIRTADSIVIEEWKSASVLRPSHRAQMGTYFLLVEEHYGRRPTHGFVVCGEGTRHRVENTPELRARVQEIAGQIREARKALTVTIAVNPSPAQCRSCGQRRNCEQGL